MKRTLVPFLLLGLAFFPGPTAAQTSRPPSGGALPGTASRGSATATTKIGQMSLLLAAAKEKPERALKLWDGLAGDLLEGLRDEEGATAKAGGAPSSGAGARGGNRSREAFVAEWIASGRDLLAWRQGLVQATEGLQSAIDSFPGRRSEWISRLGDAATNMGPGERALAEASPKPAVVRDAAARALVARNLAANVSSDAQALRDLVQRELGKKPAPPAAVTAILGRFARAVELHAGVPEEWRRAMLDAEQSVKKVHAQHLAMRAKYDATYGPVVQQQTFDAVPKFKGIAFKDLPVPPGKLEADLSALLKKLGERRVTPEDLARNAQLEAEECRAFVEWFRSDWLDARRAATLASARVCSANDCHEAQLEAAVGPCSRSAVRQLSLESAGLSAKRVGRQKALRDRLELESQTASKTFTPDKRKQLLDEIEALNEPTAEEETLRQKLIDTEAMELPECRAATAKSLSRCDYDSPECVAARALHTQTLRDLEEKEKKAWGIIKDRDKRRKSLGLPLEQNFPSACF